MKQTTCAVVLMLAVAFSANLAAEGAVASLAAARELYVGASYDDALTMLGSLSGGPRSPDEEQSIDLYRTLCLYALGKTTEAEHVIEAMLTRQPLYRPANEELSPRVQMAFQNARKRILPGLIQKEYADAKAAFDNKEWSVASAGFDEVLKSIADPDILQASGAPPLSDIKTLASGFRDLSVKMVPPPAPPKVVEAKPVPPRPTKAIYSVEDREVIAPVAIQQRVPKYPAAVTRPLVGVVEFVVDETGAVQSPRMQMTIDPSFDSLVISAAKKWTYQPALLDGKPVKYTKRLTISVAVSPPQ
jgi:hypothetical protein